MVLLFGGVLLDRSCDAEELDSGEDDRGDGENARRPASEQPERQAGDEPCRELCLDGIENLCYVFHETSPFIGDRSSWEAAGGSAH